MLSGQCSMRVSWKMMVRLPISSLSPLLTATTGQSLVLK